MQPHRDWARQTSHLVRRGSRVGRGVPIGPELLSPSSARPSPEAPQQRFGPERRIDTRLGSSPCGDGPNWPKTHTRIPPSTSSGPERCTATGYRAILHGECALGALNDLFGFPSGSVRVGGHAPAQGVHPSAVKAPCARNADLPVGRSLSTTPSPKPHVPRSAGVRAEGPRPVWVGLTSGQGILNLYQGGLERDYQDGRCLPPLAKTLWPAVDQCARRAP